MDLQFWLYLIIGVIVFLSRVLKSKEPQPGKNTEHSAPEAYREANRPQTGKPAPLTFEELLKEITEAKQPQKPVYQPQRRRVDYDEVIKSEEQDLETVETDYRNKDKQFYNTYEEAKRQAFERPSLEETMNVRNTVMDYGKFKAFDKAVERDLLAGYTKDLQDPEGLKKAFVLSEILNKKF
jgi:hypothetical protein